VQLLWAAVGVKTREDNDAVFFNPNHYSIREASHSGTLPLSIHRRESQRIRHDARQCRVGE
jgi:hypothetical protein